MHRHHSALLVAAVIGLLGPTALHSQAASSAPSARPAPAIPTAPPRALLRYGTAMPLGDGQMRTYVQADPATGAPIEIGVALSERALEGLPSAGSGHHGMDGTIHTNLLDFPAGHGTPFTFLELNWNPMGHEPDHVYQDVPHFDFHFYIVSRTVRDSIVPGHPRFAERANRLPDSAYVPAFNIALGPPGQKPAEFAVPLMGVHWLDVRSPELQALLGKPEAHKPFTATFIHGSWDGRFHFWEPMITRAHILAKRTATDPAVRDEIIALPLPAKYQQPGHYPTAYRVTWDAEAREYRIALTQLVARF